MTANAQPAAVENVGKCASAEELALMDIVPLPQNELENLKPRVMTNF